ncbi:MAG: GNAT family N-acetyltransferase [Hyphomonadaceae bacterium]
MIDIQVRTSLMWPDYRQPLLEDPSWLDLPPRLFKENRILVVEEHGEPAGFAVVTPREDGDAQLERLMVCPGHWGNDAVSRLFEASITKARTEGAWVLHTDALESAREFYETFSFVVGGRLETSKGPLFSMRRPVVGLPGTA